MPLDTSVQAKPLTATLHYLTRTAEKPVRYVNDPPPGVPQWNGIDDPRQIAIEDARGRESEFTRMPSLPCCAAAALVISRTAPFEAL